MRPSFERRGNIKNHRLKRSQHYQKRGLQCSFRAATLIRQQHHHVIVSPIMLDSFERVNQGKNMYAVIKTGGKQYKVAAGDYLKVEKLNGEVGSKVVIDKVVMIADGDDVKIGSPLVAGAKVNATVLSHGKGDKVMIFKFHRRKHYRKTQGHRQSYTEIQIDDINGKGAAKKAVKAEAAKKTEAKPAAAKPVAKKAAAKPAAKKPAAKKPAATKAKSADKE
ncbi:50S ribosomal protein L21 [Nymphon striatum]|nr:50S ribosomal protein L21 [Nymphon striatum]